MQITQQATQQATIYVTNEAFQTSQIIKDLDNYDRSNLCDETPDLANRQGYHIKNANKIHLAVLPTNAKVRFCLSMGGTTQDGTTKGNTTKGNTTKGNTVSPQVNMPANLRGCIFERAPDIPSGYADIVTYWSGQTVNANTSGAVYFQCHLNAYMVEIGPDVLDVPVINDRLLSEGVVVAITGIAGILDGLSPEDFIEIRVPVDLDMLSNEPEAFRSNEKYGYGNGVTDEHCERVFLKVADILASPDRDRIYIDLLCNELLDYGYWY